MSMSETSQKRRPLLPIIHSAKALSIVSKGPQKESQVRCFYALSHQNNPQESDFHMQARLGFRRARNKTLRLRPIDALRSVESPEGSPLKSRGLEKDRKKSRHQGPREKRAEDRHSKKLEKRLPSPPTRRPSPPPARAPSPPPMLSSRSDIWIVGDALGNTADSFAKITNATVGSVIDKALGTGLCDLCDPEDDPGLILLAAAAEEERAATRIQSLYRGNIDRQLLKMEAANRDKAATRIQSIHRGNKSRSVPKRDAASAQGAVPAQLAEEEKAAVRIQSIQRGNKSRLSLKEETASAQAATVLAASYEKAATHIQSIHRGNQSRSSSKQSLSAPRAEVAPSGAVFDEALFTKVKQILLEASSSGKLEAALAEGAKQDTTDALAKKAKEILLDATSSGKLEAVLAARAKRATDEELAKQAKECLLEASSSGKLQAALAEMIATDTEEQDRAATRIQSIHRGRMTRSAGKPVPEVSPAAAVDEEKAAVCIQSLHRGNMQRKAMKAGTPTATPATSTEAQEPKKEEATPAEEEAVSVPDLDELDKSNKMEMSTWEKWAVWGEQVFLKKAQDAAKKKNAGEDVEQDSAVNFMEEASFCDATSSIVQYLDSEEGPWKTDEEKKKLQEYSDRMKKAGFQISTIVQQTWPPPPDDEDY